MTASATPSTSAAEQLRDAYALLVGEAEMFGGRMLPLHLTPYVIGQPYRIGALEELLGWLSRQDGNWFARGSDILDSME